jgi:hypothetical protein
MASPSKPHLRPNQDDNPTVVEHATRDPIPRREPRGVEKDIADGDKKAREKAGEAEPVRNTPPAGDWNDTVPGK